MFTQFADAVGTNVVRVDGIAVVVALVALLPLLVLVIVAVVSALIDTDTSGGGKLLWVVFILWAPVFGAIAWLVVGKKGHLNRFLGIDKGRARHTVPASVGQHSDVTPNQNGHERA